MNQKVYVWDIDDFINISLAHDAPALRMSGRLRRPATVAAVEVPDGPWTFPLKLEYDLTNFLKKFSLYCR